MRSGTKILTRDSQKSKLRTKAFSLVTILAPERDISHFHRMPAEESASKISDTEKSVFGPQMRTRYLLPKKF